MRWKPLGLFVFLFVAISRFAFAEGDNIIQVARVVDANNIILNGGQEVRILGVNAPSPYDPMTELTLEEKELMMEIAYQARDFVKYLIEGKFVRLEVDARNAVPFNNRDRDGKVLAYVWFTTPVYENIPAWLVVDPKRQDGAYDALLNATIIRAGYGQVDLTWPFSFVGKFLTLKEEAKQQKRGQWNFLKEDEFEVLSGDVFQEDDIKSEEKV